MAIVTGLIVMVMYFFLLPARFEGERYAPGKAEKWLVTVGLGLAMLLFILYVVGMGQYERGFDLWFALIVGTLAVYALLTPVRMMLRIKIHPIEAWLLIFGIFFAIVFAVILPAFAG
jgi:hypothetical protein